MHQFARGRPADAGDPQAGQQSFGLILLRSLDILQQLVRALLTADDALAQQVVAPLREIIDIGDIMQIAFRDQGMDSRLAEAVDVHGIAAHEIQNVILDLRRTARVLAFDIG